VATDSSGNWRKPVATEEADHAQVERSAAAAFHRMSQHQIARSCSISQSTVHEYVSAAQSAGVPLPVPENWDDTQIEKTLFPHRPAPSVWRKHAEPDWTKIHQDLQAHKNLTLQLSGRKNARATPRATVTAGSAICTGAG